MTAPITTEDLRKLAAIKPTETNSIRRMIFDLAAELITARAKLEAAEKLEVAARKYRRFVMDNNMTDEVVPLDTIASRELSAALAAWEAAQ